MEDRLVGVTSYCERPPAARLKERVGSVTQIVIEKIVAQRPDLVLATSLTTPRDLSRLRRLGVPVRLFDDPRSFAQMTGRFMEIGGIMGRLERAREIVATAEQEVARVRREVAGLDRPKVRIQVGTNPLFAAPAHTLLNDYVEFAGGVNIAAGASHGSFSREEVVKADPDVIIMVAMGMAADHEKAVWLGFPSKKAVRHGRGGVLDAYTTCSPTPVTFVRALTEIAGALHPGFVKEGR